MIILPAIDLKGGVCVRLRQGRADDVTTYNDDPAAQARDWRDQGGRESRAKPDLRPEDPPAHEGQTPKSGGQAREFYSSSSMVPFSRT